MASLNGKWKLTEVDDKFDAYLEAIGVSPENKDKAKQLLTPGNDVTQDISIIGDEIVITTTTPAGTSETKAKVGEQIDTLSLDKRPIKTLFRIEGETLVEEQTGKFTATNKRSVEGGQMTMTQISGDVTSVRKYAKV